MLQHKIFSMFDTKPSGQCKHKQTNTKNTSNGWGIRLGEFKNNKRTVTKRRKMIKQAMPTEDGLPKQMWRG